MKRLLSIYLILSLLFLGQLNVVKGLQSNFDTDLKTSFSHQHEHSFLIILKTVMLGLTFHEHDHNHNDDDSFPWDSLPAHDSQAHSHSEFFGFKLDIFQTQKIAWNLMSSDFQLGFFSESSLISSGFRSDIFRPPISA